MTHSKDGSAILSVNECWDLMGGETLGRLITSVDGHPEIFPVNYAVQRHTVLFRTAEGTKLVSTAINNRVLFEVDDHTVTEGWSVIIKGNARSVRTFEELEEAERAQVLPWVSTDTLHMDTLHSDKPHFVRVIPETVTGRRFRFGVPLGG
jgi:hypothetical protein